MARRWSVLAACLGVGLLGGARWARAADNLVFVPVPPCRVIDTRVSGAGGPLVAGTPRSFVFRGPTLNYQNPSPFPNQGGSTTGCGIPDLTSDFSPFQNLAKAVAINIVAVGPAGAGDLRAWPANQPVPNASVINYAAVTGLNIANGVIVPMCDEVAATPCTGGDITFRADVHGTQLVVDVVGYFHAGSTAFTMFNTALGHGALEANTSGSSNTASGADALYSNTTGSFNTANGANALSLNTAGYSNTAHGAFALNANTTGHANTASGVSALRANTTGIGNTAIGASALSGSVGGNHNTAIGYLALGLSTTSAYNTAVGSRALLHNSSGGNNTAIGFRALDANTIGNGNIAIGNFALSSNTYGVGSTATGPGALESNTTGGSNTALGIDALQLNTSGSRNIGIGASAGAAITTGNDNIDIGNPGVSGDASTTRIGSAQAKTFIAGIRGVTTDTNDAVAVLIDSSGQLGTASSSIRFKEDVHDLGSAADRVLDLRPVSFRYKKPFANGEKPVQYGLIAEEVEKILPELVAYGKDGKPETVKYQVLPTLLLAELEKEHARLGEQDEKLRQKDQEIAALRREKDEQIAALLVRIERLEGRPGERNEASAAVRARPPR